MCLGCGMVVWRVTVIIVVSRAERVEGSVLFGGRVRVGDVSRTQSE